METEKYGHVSIARKVEFDFFEDNVVAASVSMNRFGQAFSTIDGVESPLLNNIQNGNHSFAFTKSGLEFILKFNYYN